MKRRAVLLLTVMAMALILANGVALGMTIYCTAGVPCIGTMYDDTLYGTDGDDIMFGSVGNDRLLGYGGNDTMNGEWDRDTLWGGYGNDSLFGGTESDNLHGGEDDDVLLGEEDDDDLSGGNGNDTYVFGDVPWGYDRILDEPSGVDTIDLSTVSLPYGFRINLPSPDQACDKGFFPFYNFCPPLGVVYTLDTAMPASVYVRSYDPSPPTIENAYGGPGDDVIRADRQGQDGSSPINNTLYGNDGQDVIYGGYGLDVLYGGAGNDALFGLGDADSLYGEGGHDKLVGDTYDIFDCYNPLYRNIGAEDNLVGGEGDDWLVGQSGADWVQGGEGNDRLLGDFDCVEVLNPRGPGGDDIVLGGPGRDFINGGEYDDWLFGDSGSDTIIGSYGDDLLVGDALFLPEYSGFDRFSGGAGYDLIYAIDGKADPVISCGPDRDIVRYDAGLDEPNSDCFF